MLRFWCFLGKFVSRAAAYWPLTKRRWPWRIDLKEQWKHKNIFAFKFTLSSQQPDIVSIICHQCHCHRCRWYRRQICHRYQQHKRNWCQQRHRCRWYRWCTFTCEYLREFSKKFEKVLMGYSGAGGKLIHEKNQKQKISWHCPFKYGVRSTKFIWAPFAQLYS